MAQETIDALHDLLEGTSVAPVVGKVISHALLHGGSGVWEQAGSWLAKLSYEYPEIAALWVDLAAATTARQRLRIAAFVCDVPEQVFDAIMPILIADKSAKVRSKTVGDLCFKPRPIALKYLQARLPAEPDAHIASNIALAIDSSRTGRPPRVSSDSDRGQ